MVFAALHLLGKDFKTSQDFPGLSTKTGGQAFHLRCRGLAMKLWAHALRLHHILGPCSSSLAGGLTIKVRSSTHHLIPFVRRESLLSLVIFARFNPLYVLFLLVSILFVVAEIRGFSHYSWGIPSRLHSCLQYIQSYIRL